MGTAKNEKRILFEVSWEVCNKVGGIYAVVSTKVMEAVEEFGDNYYTIGPDMGTNAEFEETDETCWDAIRPALEAANLHVRLGRWNIPGRPKTILVRFNDRYDQNQLLYELWNNYGVDSLSGGWDYIEPVMFSTACGDVIIAVSRALNKDKEHKVLAHFHEWMCGGGLMRVKSKAPEIGTVFTTHATILGRSMAGSGFDIYKQMGQINPKQQAGVYNITAKSSMESISAQQADCFTTVGKITADESVLFLGRKPDVLTLNGLDLRVIPDYSVSRDFVNNLKKNVLDAAGRLFRQELPRTTRIMIISGRYEFHNKGIDVFMEALAQANQQLSQSHTDVLVIASVMGGHSGVNHDAISGDPNKQSDQGPYWISSHYVHDKPNDRILNACSKLGLDNRPDNKIRFMFIPALLDGNDGFLNMLYYDLLSVCDLGVFPSWYEPWGYTPQESAAFSVPTVTTDLSGFGLWVRELKGIDKSGVTIIPRQQKTFADVVTALRDVILEFASADEEFYKARRAAVHELVKKCSWEHFYAYYVEAYDMAIDRAKERTDAMDNSSGKGMRMAAVNTSFRPVLHSFNAIAKLPKELDRLRELANNLWWSWNPDSWELFSDLNQEEWEKSGHNPVATLERTSLQRLNLMAKDGAYVKHYKDVIKEFDKYMKMPLKKFGIITKTRPVAYFSAEYGLHESIPIYSGGLGVLSGDHIKSASDLCLPLVGIGLLYKNGYFRQSIDKDGRQIALYPANDFAALPVSPVYDKNGEQVMIDMHLPGRKLYALVWEIKVGRVSIYLMDTDTPKNTADDRRITANLYEANRDFRLRQELLLGVGGVKLLKALKIEPSAYHMNEGHSALLIFERIRNLMLEEGMSFEQAGEYVRGTNIFTTHTPVDAGNEHFPMDRMAPYFSYYCENIGVDWKKVSGTGHFGDSSRNIFEMTVLALKYSYKANGVSELHGRVSRNMWQRGWNNIPVEEVPIGHVTNGIHLPSYVAYPMKLFLDRELGDDWFMMEPGNPVWEKINDIPDKQLHAVKLIMKAILIERIKNHMPSVFKKFNIEHSKQKEILGALNHNALIIGFARRFAPYKRANMLFADPERLHRIVSDEDRPVIFLFSGKAHPADTQGADILRNIINHCLDPRFFGKVFFLEDYSLEISRAMVQGCDIWLNTPRRPYEASGTSGQKVPVNGGLNLSISDGWWAEGDQGNNGWTIGTKTTLDNTFEDQGDYADAAALYALLEDIVIPMYYSVGDKLSTEWSNYVKNSMISLSAQFSSYRMLNDYIRDYYTPAAERGRLFDSNDKVLPKHLSAWKQNVTGWFSTVKITDIYIEGVDGDVHVDSTPLKIKVTVEPGNMPPDNLLVQLVVGVSGGQDFLTKPEQVTLEKTAVSGKSIIFCGKYKPSKEGKHTYGIRVLPYVEGLGSHLETGLVLWG